jgi:mannan endo-1,4-beta-mannosidase
VNPKLAGAVLGALVATAALGCAATDESLDQDRSDEAAASTVQAADPNASVQARVVLANLRSFDLASQNGFDRRILLGQQEFDVSNRARNGLDPLPSEVQAIAGRPPGLVSYELSAAYRGATTMFDRAAFAAGRGRLRELILDQRKRGILVSLVWHMRCPKASPGTPDKYAPADCPPDYNLEELLELKPDGRRGAHFDEWRGMLDEIAELLWSLKDDRGNVVPVHLRPMHEHTGAWFWWGRDNDASAFVGVWRHMVTYLREGRGLHDVLWVFCPASPTDPATRGYQATYPGDAFVDVVAFDRYDLGSSFSSRYADDLAEIGAFARAHGKVAAVAEVGREWSQAGISRDTTWFTRTMLAPLERRSFAYVGLWRNAPWEKFVPEPADGPLADDFRAMATSPSVLLAGKHDLYRALHATY